MSRFVRLFAGLFLVSSLSGCCLLGHGCGGGGYAPYSNQGCGSCGANAGGYPSAMYAPGYQQAAFAQPMGYSTMAAAPPVDVLAN